MESLWEKSWFRQRVTSVTLDLQCWVTVLVPELMRQSIKA